MKYRRVKIKGGAYFFTVVTHQRSPIFSSEQNIKILKESFKCVMVDRPFVIDAYVILPDHMHCIWTLPKGDSDYSTRWRIIKGFFTHEFFNGSSVKGEKQTIWQKRFWEHAIRNEEDFIKHADYIHYNPVKHGYAEKALYWRHSSLAKFLQNKSYQSDWDEGRLRSLDNLNISD
ncbi:REP-associated tyrosine transposase [Desulfatibacillum aliphaticivorans]|uniref:REP-associated tyrosine transposase n=1 Tax=Desulfatibacillum aliphaticivorans TaxID=218208 RepID=UPI00048163D7|nr:transposase [Desulfatibacillum aliphaticivorans]